MLERVPSCRRREAADHHAILRPCVRASQALSVPHSPLNVLSPFLPPCPRAQRVCVLPRSSGGRQPVSRRGDDHEAVPVAGGEPAVRRHGRRSCLVRVVRVQPETGERRAFVPRGSTRPASQHQQVFAWFPTQSRRGALFCVNTRGHGVATCRNRHCHARPGPCQSSQAQQYSLLFFRD